MSKYSPKNKISGKLEEGITQQTMAATLADKDDLTPEEIKLLPASEFELASYDEAAAERTGYSNYSYWKSTVIMFFKNKVAVAMLIVMLALMIFTFIQPLPTSLTPIRSIITIPRLSGSLWRRIPRSRSPASGRPARAILWRFPMG